MPETEIQYKMREKKAKLLRKREYDKASLIPYVFCEECLEGITLGEDIIKLKKMPYERYPSDKDVFEELYHPKCFRIHFKRIFLNDKLNEFEGVDE